ncbi:MAG: M50 family metallopeptidase [Defluviitaleaceae bacterium]|nr:M50 family metallopeptidase [Defluviitaleaceae bacterium]MCL2275263.1 M50 family metallopeptidase [Defluviitaleaceae bacterium]
MGKKLKKIIIFLMPFIIGGALGIIGVRLAGLSNTPAGGLADMPYIPEPLGIAGLFVHLVAVFFTVMGGVYFHIIVHEAGHLICGKLSGYGFISFRVRSFTIINKNGKLLRKKYALGGTDGQCLMSPPEMGEDSQFPFVLYNLGGGLANLLSSAVFFAIGYFTAGLPSLLLNILAILGVILGLINLIPMKIGGITNDGRNLLTCLKDAQARRALWIQLKFAALITQGVRPCDMPEEWGLDELGKGTLWGFVATFRHNYLLDKGEIDEARAYARDVLADAGQMLEMYKTELKSELLFHELIDECRNDEIEALYNKEMEAHVKALASHASKQRLLYAYHKLYRRDEAEAEKALAAFERACMHTPFEGEVAGERALVALVREKGA